MFRNRLASLFAPISCALACLVASAGLSHAAGIPAEVDLTSLRCIQLSSLDSKADDQCYFLVTGIAVGKDINTRLPADKTFTAAPKKVPFTDKAPLVAWKGDLDAGEFALVTVTLMQGDGTDTDKVKQYLDKLTAADKLTAEWSNKALTKADVPKFCTGLIKNQQAVVTKIKEIFPRDPKNDHFGGQFNVLVWNNDGKISKRLDPIGLTFGEHFGIDLKIYSKLKATRVNALVQDDTGQWTQQQLLPLDDAETTIRVKSLETELQPDKVTKHVTDYLTEVQVKDSTGKPLGWTLQGENTGYDVVHTYNDYAD
jgi:hypothetical protein